MASSGAHVRAEAAERHIHHHAHLTSSLHPVKPAQFAFTVSREPDHDTTSPRPATERLDLSYASNARPLIRSLSAHSPLKKNFLDLRIVSDEDCVPDGEGMDVDELHRHFRGWSFENGNVKTEGPSTRVSLSPTEVEPPSRHDPQQPRPEVTRARSLGRVKRHPPLPKESANFRATLTRAQTRLEPQRATAYATMVKERRSLQSILIPSFLHSPPQSVHPTPTVPNAPIPPKKRSSVLTSSGDATRDDAKNKASGSPDDHKVSAVRPTIKNRARAQTYTAGPSASRTARASTKGSVDWSWPHVTTKTDGHASDALTGASTPAGRESPSSYLLDDDPFASIPTNAPALSPTSTISSPGASVPVTPSLTSPLESLPLKSTPLIVSSSTVGTSSMASPAGTDRGSRSPPGTSMLSPTSPLAPPSPLNPNAKLTIRSTPTSPTRKSAFLIPELPTALLSSSSPIVPPSRPPSASTGSTLSFSVSHTQASLSSRIQLPGPRPAHTRPAFTPRPSLPSLSTLARMDVPVSALSSWGMPIRVRKRRGKVGAGLPLEPWDEPMDEPLLFVEGSSDQEFVSPDHIVESTDENGSESPPNRDSNITPTANDFATERMDRLAKMHGDLESRDRILLEDALSSSINGSNGDLVENVRILKDLPPIPSEHTECSFAKLESTSLNAEESEIVVRSDELPAIPENANLDFDAFEVYYQHADKLDSFLSPPSPESSPQTFVDGNSRRLSATDVSSSGVDGRLSQPDLADSVSDTREGQLAEDASNPDIIYDNEPLDRQWSSLHDDAETLTDVAIARDETSRVAEETLNGEALHDNTTAQFTWLRAATSTTSSSSAAASSPSSPRPASPHSSTDDDDFGVELNASPSYYTSALQHLTDDDDLDSGEHTRPESLLLDPFLSSTSNSSARSSLGFNGDDVDFTENGRLSRAAELRLHEQLQHLEAEQHGVDEDDSSMLPPLSTLPEDDPLFSLAPSRRATRTSEVTMAELPSKAGLSSIEYARRLLVAVKQRHGMHASISSSGSGSAIEELGLRRYESSPSPPTVSTSSITSESDNSHVPHSSPSRAAPHASSSSIDDADLATGADADAETGWRPFDEKTAGFEPGSSASTLRPSSQMRTAGTRQKSSLTNDIVANWRLKHAIPAEAPPKAPLPPITRASSRKTPSSSENHDNVFFHQNSNGRRSGRDQSSESDVGDRRPPSRGGGKGGPGRGSGGAGDEDEDDRHNRSATSTTSSSRNTSDSESSESEDDYGVEATPVDVAAYSQRRNGRKGVFRPPNQPLPKAPSENSSRYASTEEDNVPLGQRIPRALEVQQSIRQQVRDERERRKQRQGRTSEDVPSTAPVEARGRTIGVTRVPFTALNTTPGALSSSQEAAILAMQKKEMAEGLRRARSATRGEVKIAFAADDLTRRLLKVQAQPMAESQRAGPSSVSRPNTRTSEDLNHNGERYPTLPRHPPLTDRVSTGTTASAPAQRSHQMAFSPTSIPRPHHSQPPVDTGKGLRHMRSFHHTSNPHSTSPSVSIARRPSSSKGRTSAGDVTDSEMLGRSKTIKSSRPSIEEARTQQPEYPQQPPVPPLPPLAALQTMPQGPTSPRRSEYTSQMRIFVGDLQRFNMVEVGPQTNAKEVLDIIRNQGDLSDNERVVGGWMVFELCQDFGMERPLRNFEILSHVSNSWNREKTTNAFMVKRTPLAAPLSSVPASLPVRTGYVEYEIKKGKWSRRWLELREHGLWLSKRQGKDDEFLCSLSGFDAYILTKPYKAPYSFTFAVKSTERISLFENKSDYLHVFSCPTENGMPWIEAILLARSYVLYQEKHVLFKNRAGAAAPNQAPAQQGAALSRSNTRARPPNGRPNPPPFLNVQAANFNTPSTQLATPFEKGSLLAKRTADGL